MQPATQDVHTLPPSIPVPEYEPQVEVMPPRPVPRKLGDHFVNAKFHRPGGSLLPAHALHCNTVTNSDQLEFVLSAEAFEEEARASVAAQKAAVHSGQYWRTWRHMSRPTV